MMNRTWIPVVTILLIGAFSANSQELDPLNRDEDISESDIEMSFSINAEGYVEYLYEVSNPASNKGTISYVEIDLSCDYDFSGSGFDPADYRDVHATDISLDGLHVPAAISSIGFTVNVSGITSNNQAFWAKRIYQGESLSGFRLVSPQMYGYRLFTLTPKFSFDEPWDYTGIDGDDESIPWVEDFTVYGLVLGPACPGEELNSAKPVIFPGSLASGRKWHEPRIANKLVGYGRPTRDRMHVPGSQTNLPMQIFYDENIDPSTFEVISDDPSIPPLFNPQPGEYEEVFVPLNSDRTFFEIRVKGDVTNPDTGEVKTVEDVDYFEVRKDI